MGAEYVTGLVPRGTHEWSKFLTPGELAMMAADAGLGVEAVAGMSMSPLTGRWTLGDDLSVNYIAIMAHKGEGGTGGGAGGQ